MNDMSSDQLQEAPQTFQILDLLSALKHHMIKVRWLSLLNIKEEDFNSFEYISKEDFNRGVQSISIEDVHKNEKIKESPLNKYSYKKLLPSSSVALPKLRSIFRNDVASAANKVDLEKQDIVPSDIIQYTCLERADDGPEVEIIPMSRNDPEYQTPSFGNKTNSDAVGLKELGGPLTDDIVKSDYIPFSSGTILESEIQLLESSEINEDVTQSLLSEKSVVMSEDEDNHSEIIDLLSEQFQDFIVHGDTLSSFDGNYLFSDDISPLPPIKKARLGNSSMNDQVQYEFHELPSSSSQTFHVLDSES